MRHEWAKIQRKQKIQADYPEHKTAAGRHGRLVVLRRMISDHESEWIDTLAEDLGKSPIDAYVSEIGLLLAEMDRSR